MTVPGFFQSIGSTPIPVFATVGKAPDSAATKRLPSRRFPAGPLASDKEPVVP